jgi:putative addiction module component (TIGR02574 family)
MDKLREGCRMTPTVEQLLNDALALPDDDRLELVEALIVSFQPHDRPPFDESWREVIRRRSAELAAGSVVPVPWEEVKRQARESEEPLPGRPVDAEPQDRPTVGFASPQAVEWSWTAPSTD